MLFKDFRKTDIYKNADVVTFLNKNGEEIDAGNPCLVDMEVINVNESKEQSGEIEVTVIAENEIYYL